MELVESLGHEVTYAYEDLIFINHNDFLLQFTREPDTLDLFFNTVCSDDESGKIMTGMIDEASKRGLTILRKGTYTMKEAPDNTLQIVFQQ